MVEIKKKGYVHKRAPDGKLLPGQPSLAPNGRTGRNGSRVRDKLSGEFIAALQKDFAIHGEQAIESCRLFDAGAYLKIIASLLPKEVTIRPEEQMSDDELENALKRLLLADIADALAERENRSLVIIEGKAETQRTQ